MNSTNHTKTSALAALMLGVAALAGCGGGGGDTPPAPTPTPSGPPVEPPAVTSVPEPVYTDARSASAFRRLNEARKAAGIGELEQNQLVDQAALNHSKYMALHDALGHTEVPGLDGYTGVDFVARVVHAGYVDSNKTSESAARINFSSVTSESVGTNLIDQLLGAPYHRAGLLDAQQRYVGIGVGVDGIGRNAFITVDMVSNDRNRQGSPGTPVWIWPPADSQDVPTATGKEEPNPIPENNDAPAGYAASVHVNSAFRSVSMTQCEMKDAAGNVVVTKILSTGVDPYTGPDFAACLPRAPLKKNTRYTVTVTGSVTENYSGKKDPLVKTWSFTTGEKEFF